jgi:hypothetical protein
METSGKKPGLDSIESNSNEESAYYYEEAKVNHYDLKNP